MGHLTEGNDELLKRVRRIAGTTDDSRREPYLVPYKSLRAEAEHEASRISEIVATNKRLKVWPVALGALAKGATSHGRLSH